MANLEHPFLEFVSGNQKTTLCSSNEGNCVSIQSLDTENTSSEVPYGFLWTGPGLPGTWAGAQYKHVHKSLCICLCAAFISH